MERIRTRLGIGWRTLLILALLALGTTASAHTAEQGLMTLLFMKAGCDRIIPGFQAATAAPYAGWRQAHAAIAQQMEQSPEFQQMLAEMAAKTPGITSPEEKAQWAQWCEDVADLLGPAGAPDPRFASPETTWATFQAALRAGDRATATACLILQAKRNFTAVAAQLPDTELHQIADPPQQLVLGSRVDDTQEGEILRGGRSFLILFQYLRGEWKISTL